MEESGIRRLPQEVIDMIAHLLYKPDLAIAARVCSGWHHLFTPILGILSKSTPLSAWTNFCHPSIGAR